MSDEAIQGPGSRLKNAREGMEVSTREVADALNLPIRVIEALEADDFDELQPTVFTRGYLRSYARLLELPGDELLALYPAVQADSETGIPEVRETPGLDASQLKLAMAGAAVLIVVVVVLVWIFSGDDAADVDSDPDGGQAVERLSEPPEVPVTVTAEPTPAAESPQVDRPEAQVDRSEAQVDRSEAQVDRSEAQDDRPEPEEDRQEADVVGQEAPVESPQVSAADQSLPDSVQAQAALPGEPGVRRITEFGDDLITFTFSDECWVEVKSLDGANLYSDLSRAGRTLKLTGKGPFRILLGYAPGVSLEFNGEPVVLSRYTRNNVASLVLGE